MAYMIRSVVHLMDPVRSCHQGGSGSFVPPEWIISTGNESGSDGASIAAEKKQHAAQVNTKMADGE